MKKIKKILQNSSKFFFYKVFSLFYGNIKGKINSESDPRIKIETIKKENNLKYKIYKIKNGRLYTDRVHDVAIILDNFIVEGPSYQLRTVDNAPAEKNIVFQKGTARIKKKLKGTVLSLLTGGAGNENYFHWMYDVLPRFALCEKTSDLNKVDFFLLPDTIKKFQQESLDILNISKEKRISSKSFRHITCSELIVTDHPYVITNNASNDIQNIPLWISEWLKEKYTSNEINNKSISPKKIYIDRSDSTSNTKALRLIINENEVKQFLKKNGFENIILGNMHFRDQVKIFNNAEIIIGLHGAGFANLCYCKPGTKIIEFKSTTDGKMFENLAISNSLVYKSINSEAIKFKVAQYGHINVSINSLKKTIESLN